MSDLPQGFTPISGKRSPPKGDKRYAVHFRGGFTDYTGYTASQLVWVHSNWDWDVIGVREINA